MIPCYVCMKPSAELSPRSRCARCEYERSVSNERQNEELHRKLASFESAASSPLSWHPYHMGFAKHAARKSKDSTQVGAVAIGQHKQVVETGFNGPPRGVQDLPERRERPAKYLYAAHAEANLVATAARSRLEGSTIYVTHLCCSGCTKSLIQAGVAKVVFGEGKTSMPDEEFEAAKVMFKEAGVELLFMPGDGSEA